MLIIKLLSAYCLDILFADPYRIPHPVQVIGWFISRLEKMTPPGFKKQWGAAANLLVLSTTFFVCLWLARLHWVIEVYLLYTCLATRSLADEALKVKNIIEQDDISLARQEIGYLVSRDTSEMDKKQIIRSTLETVAENSVDAVVSPLFYMLLGALLEPYLAEAMLAFAMLYKAVNTFDSMWGYKTARYKELGWFSARLDDWANYLPARLTGGILLPVSAYLLNLNWKNAWYIFKRDRCNHASPNSGHPESAVAGALDIQFGGRTQYFGEWQDKPTIGDKNKPFTENLIDKAVWLLWSSSLLMLAVIFIILIFTG
ncbi:adenosylcobinamide-phosphate synthase CbiB [Psychromonas aquimarina]|uniref:adenosylcobinamide-phosphate synthase CbiB n=1 Tax=Psychromonas aquimarina TaxID=444919 RepID=UPI0003FC4908|nr:adenosylcobinamide-phosphate synthase CbiB [Psychromonas aquimarina]